MATLPSPNQDAIQSTALRPGKLNTGRIILVNSVPINSSKPKFISNGSNMPAKMNTLNSDGNRSFKISAPVSPDVIASGPTPKKVITTNMAPSMRTTSQAGVTLSSELKNA